MTEKNEIYESLKRSEEKKKKLIKYISLFSILFGIMLYSIIAYYLYTLNPDISYDIVFFIVIAPLAVAALGYGIYEKKKRKEYRQAHRFAPRLSIPQARPKDPFKEEKKNALKFVLTFSIVLFPCLVALIGLMVFYSEVRSFILFFVGEDLWFLGRNFLVMFAVILSVMFAWSLRKYILVKRKISDK